MSQHSRTLPVRRSLAAALVWAMMLLAAPTAACAAAAASAAPADWAFVDVGAQYQEGTSYYLVGGELPTDTPLPAAVELAVPAGSTPQWVGEIAMTQSSADKELPYTTTKRGTMDVYSLTLTGSRLGQAETLAPGVFTVNGAEYRVALNWVAPGPVPRVRIAVAMPPNAIVESPAKDAKISSDPSGNKFYFREQANVKTGDAVALNFTYTIPTATDSGSTGDGSSGTGGSTVLLVILGVGVVVVAGLLLVVLRQRRSAPEGETDDAEEQEPDLVEDTEEREPDLADEDADEDADGQ